MAVPPIDFATTVDLESAGPFCADDQGSRFCAGTPLDGTCAQTFFAAFADCFRPCGSCQAFRFNSGVEYKWQSGAIDDNEYGRGIGNTSSYFPKLSTSDSDSCLLRRQIWALSGAVDSEQFCAPNDPSCVVGFDVDAGADTFSGGQLYDHATGIFTCSDGTQVNLGPNLGGCVALNGLLDPTYCTFP